MSDRVALITGGGSGIGLETAVLLAERGWSLVLAGRRENALLEAAAKCLQAGSPKVVPVPCDVTRAAEVERLAKALAPLSADSSRAVLVNCAGTSILGNFEERSIEEAVEQIEVNLIGLMRATHAVLPALRSSQLGHVVNILSVASTHSFSGAAAYCAAKAGALAFGRCLAMEIRRSGVRVTNVLPGATDTAIWDRSNWKPEPQDMLTVRVVAETIRDVIESPADRSIDEIAVMPPRGIL